MNAIHVSRNRIESLRQGIAFFFVLISLLFLCMFRGNVLTAIASKTPEDGVYTIDGKLCSATSDKSSMGNDALKKPFTLIIKNSKASLRMELVPLTAKAGSSSFTGYLAQFKYFPDWEEDSQPTGEKGISADIESYYEDLYDSYNDSKNGLDDNVKGKLYPHFMTMPVDLYDEEIWTQVYVPVMEAISSGSGSQYARLVLDWDSLEKKEDSEDEDSDEKDQDQEEADEKDSDQEKSKESESTQTPDKTALHNLLVSASSLVGRENVYTADSLTKLKNAISEAEAVYENSDSTQIQINTQASLLSSAIVGLQQLSGSSSSDSSSGSSGDSSGSSGSSSGSSGDSSGSSSSEDLDINSLSDGIYKLTGKMYKIDKSSLSMANNAISHNIRLTVKDGKYYLTMDLEGLQINTQYGYLSSMKYFATGYSVNKYGAPAGDVVSVTVDSYQKDSDGNIIKDSYGSNYPDQITFPMIPEAKEDGWVPLQVFEPIMDAISSGSGTQAVYLGLDLTSLSTADSSSSTESSSGQSSASSSGTSSGSSSGASSGTSSGTSSGSSSGSSGSSSSTSGKSSGTSSSSKDLDIRSLSDGTYKLTGKMYKIDKSTLSMANDAINHKIRLRVKNGKYYLTMYLKGLQMNSQYGYLSKMKYFVTGYTTDKYGAPAGTVKSVTVNSYQEDSDGNRIEDSYGSDYPYKITFPMISEAKKDGWVPLQVFVPIMEAISSGSGTQAVYLGLDLSSLSTADSSSFTDSSSGQSGSASSSTASTSSTASSAGTTSSDSVSEDSTQTASALIAGSSLPGSANKSLGAEKSLTSDSAQENAANKAASADFSDTDPDSDTLQDARLDSENTQEAQETSSQESSGSPLPVVMSFLAVLAGGCYKLFSRRMI